MESNSPTLSNEAPFTSAVGRESPYAAYWHPIAESHEITEQPKQFWLLNEPLVGFRTEEGIGVFKDLCIHRGAQLSLGSVSNGRLACPYHGFEYDLTGACTRIPSIPEGQSIPRKARAIAYHVKQAFGLVWVAMNDPVRGLPVWPNDEWGSEGTRSIMAHRCQWNAGAGRVIENFLDVSHFPFVHEGFLGSRDNTLVPQYDTVEVDGGLYYKHMQQEPGDPHTGEGELVTLEYHLTVPFACHLRRTTPNGEWSLFSIFVSPRTDKTSDIFLPIVRDFELDPAQDHIFEGIIKRAMDEDQAVVEGQRPEELPVDLSEELHIKVPDAAGVVYRRLLRDIEAGAASGGNGAGATSSVGAALP